MTNDIRITTSEDGRTITVAAPYEPSFPSAARRIGGKFDKLGKVWIFDVRDEERVRALVVDIYGTDRDSTAETVTVRIDVGDHQSGNEAFFGGRRIAYREWRDARVTLGKGVVIISGRFPSSAGSMRYPKLGVTDPVIVEVRDIPAAHSDLELDSVTVVDTRVDPEALAAERARLVERIAAIDTKLSALVADTNAG